MNKYFRLISGFFLLSLGLFLAKPTYATTINVSGNGADSSNSVHLQSTTQTFVTQTNNANIANSVGASATTGDNSTSNNTGGDNSIDTGNAQASVAITNSANQNSSQLATSGCCDGSGNSQTSVSVNVEANGATSQNTVSLNLTNTNVVNVTNNTRLNNDVEVVADTGHNVADSNTGGNVRITTGDATTSVTISNNVNRNDTVITCCGVGGPKPPGGPPGGPPPSTPPTTPTTIALVPASQRDQVLGVGGGLPETGGNNLILGTIGLLLLSFGLFLRRLGRLAIVAG